MHVQNEVFLWLMHVEGVEYEKSSCEDTRKVSIRYLAEALLRANLFLFFGSYSIYKPFFS